MQTSSKQIDQDVNNQIENQFYKTLSQIRSESEMRSFLKAFLSETEQTVLQKRFAILSCVSQKKSYSSIEKLLKVSSATVSNISKLATLPAIKKVLDEQLAEEWAVQVSTKIISKFPKMFRNKTTTEIQNSAPNFPEAGHPHA